MVRRSEPMCPGSRLQVRCWPHRSRRYPEKWNCLKSIAAGVLRVILSSLSSKFWLTADCTRVGGRKMR